MITKEEANEKVEGGWIKTWMMFEVLAVNEKTTRDSLEGLMNRLEDDKRVSVYKKEFGNMKKVEKPVKNVDFGFSLTCEVEMISKKLDNLVQIIIEYGPSAIEILEPSKLEINAGEAQAILNSISQVMHQFAAAGVGGIVLMKNE